MQDQMNEMREMLEEQLRQAKLKSSDDEENKV